MQLVAPDNPILHKLCRANFTVTVQDIRQMFTIMREHKALGLAAPQVGIDARLFVTEWNEVFVNPRVVDMIEPILSTEGCLSLPGVTVTMRRWNTIHLADGRMYEETQARIIQHELDHLNGRLITDYPWNKSF